MPEKSGKVQLSAGLIEDDVMREIDKLYSQLMLELQNSGKDKIPRNIVYPTAIIDWLHNQLGLLETVQESKKALAIERFLEKVDKVLKERFVRER